MEILKQATLAPMIKKHLPSFLLNFIDKDNETLNTFLLHNSFTDSCEKPNNKIFDRLVQMELIYIFHTKSEKCKIKLYRNFTENINFLIDNKEYASSRIKIDSYNKNLVKYSHTYGYHCSYLDGNSFNYTLLNSEEQTHADPRQAYNSNDISHASYDEPTASYINTFILTYIPLIIYIVGVLGNSLSLSVLVRKRMRRVSTYTYLSVLSVVDTLVLTMGLLQLWIGERSNLGWLRDQSNVACKTLNVFSYSMSDLSVWLIIAVTVERFIAVCHPLRAASMCRRRTALKVVSLLFLLLLTVNAHFIWTTELKEFSEMFSTYEITEEGTNLCSSVKKSRCMAAGGHEDFIQKYWPWVDAIFYSFLPFVVIISLNCMIIRRVMVARRRRWKMISQSSVSVNRSDATSAHLHQHQLNARFKKIFHKEQKEISNFGSMEVCQKQQKQQYHKRIPNSLLDGIYCKSNNHFCSPITTAQIAVSTTETLLNQKIKNPHFPVLYSPVLYSPQCSTAHELHTLHHQTKLIHQTTSTLSLTDRTSSKEQNETKCMLSIMLLTISFAFIIMTLPRNIYFILVYWSNSHAGSAMHDVASGNRTDGYNKSEILENEEFRTHANLLLASTLTEMLMFLNHSSNFFLYCATGQKFRMELKKMLFPWKSCLSSALCRLLCCFPSRYPNVVKNKNKNAVCKYCKETENKTEADKKNRSKNENATKCNTVQQLEMHAVESVDVTRKTDAGNLHDRDMHDL
ncbi:hypothetical protein HELRODRAFT_189703 [Helobdella robusta]|uniref:G-protein coupled receptors family 1 profile domain-containing protein n=1 Tax=Helobdella robusta TaxID=6412 RepID=T1FRA1_HELRO|nr:hypothetical protein HELRODRAFT_189703 [Helobdella robusta]ESN91497.1 hypothetical protein HELRODRAFT_189703 [Helobdella robusta]